jgi:hypothetical protein
MEVQRPQRAFESGPLCASVFKFEGMFRAAHGRQGSKPRHRMVLDHRRRMAAIRATFERWLDPSNFDSAGRQKAKLAARKNLAGLTTRGESCACHVAKGLNFRSRSP